MNPPRGKIGRLSKAIQEQVNRRLDAGEKGAPLVAWLNSLPEVQAVMAAEFAGRPVREQNLSAWRKRGYQRWACRHEAADFVAEAKKSTTPVSEQLATWASARYLLAVRQLLTPAAGRPPDFRLIRKFCQDVIGLRRSEHFAARVKLDAERLQFQRAKMWPQQVSPGKISPNENVTH